jgi:hypothetical protein
MRATKILAIGSTTWRVLAAYDFENHEVTGRAALVEGATLLLLRPDTLLEGIPLLEIQEITEPVLGATITDALTIELTLRDGRPLSLKGELADLDLLQRWVGYLKDRQRRSRVRSRVD